MPQVNKYTNIRYHIYKELSKYRKFQEKHRADRIDEIAIPIITGIVVILITNRWTPRLNGISDSCYIGFIIVMTIVYGLLLKILKFLFYYYVNKIKPNANPIKRIKADDKEFSPKQEEDAAKFNYEVTYLVESAYNQINRIDTQDKYLYRITLLNTLFCIKNALRKIQESLLGDSGRINTGLVSASMIKLVLEMVEATLNKIQEYSSADKLYTEDADFIMGKYRDIEEQIKDKYNI